MAALLLAGCGGGGDDDSTESTAVTTAAPTALTKAELIEQGDAICAEVNAAVGTVGASSAEIGSPAGTGRRSLQRHGCQPARTSARRRKPTATTNSRPPPTNLPPPRTKSNSPPSAATRPGLETAESNASSALTSFQNAASEYGFEDCSEGPSAPVTTAPGAESGEAEAGEEAEAVEPEAVEPEAEAEPAPEVAPETGGAGGAVEGGGTGGGTEGGGGRPAAIRRHRPRLGPALNERGLSMP